MFWSTAVGKRAVLAGGPKSLDDRTAALIKDPRPSGYTEVIRNEVFADFERMADEVLQLREDDFLYGFHVFPDNSTSHLHLHVFPHDNSFRNHSTHDYDVHTVPIQAILDVEAEHLSTVERDTFFGLVKRDPLTNIRKAIPAEDAGIWRRFVEA